MRAEFVSRLVELAERDSRIALLTGDLGYTVLEPFAERIPDRFLNVGVAEQNMVGIATGLAEAGLIPFVYSISTFLSMRPYEFIRNGPVLHDLPVRLVGVGAGFDYGHNGVTHYALEDVGIARLQPGLEVIAPADPAQACAALTATVDTAGPIYYRLGRESAAVPGLEGRFERGRTTVLREGEDLVILALGTAARAAMAAASLLDADGVSSTVAVISTVNPPPVQDLADLVEPSPLALTVEGHYVVGGIGSLVAEIIAERAVDCRLVRAGVRVMPRGKSGTPEYLNDEHGLSPARLADDARRALGELCS